MTAPGGTSVTGGTGGRGGKIVSPLPRLVTIVVTVAVAGDRELPLMVTVRLIGSPGCAVFLPWSVTSISVARLAGRVPSLHVFLFTVGHMMNAGAICERALCERVAVTPMVRTVLQTQIEYVTKPPGNVCVLFATSWFVTQRAPARWCLGDGDGLGDLVCEREGEGLGVLDVVGLGLLLVGDGLGLLVSDGLELAAPVELAVDGDAEDALADGLVVALGESLGETLAGLSATSRLTVTAAEVFLPHGEAWRAAGEATAGAAGRAAARKDAAARLKVIRLARLIISGTEALRAVGRRGSALPSDVSHYPQT